MIARPSAKRRHRPGFRLSFANDTGDNEVWVVESRAIGGELGNSPTPRLREWSRAFPARHGWGSIRPEKPSKQATQPTRAAFDRGIAFGVRALQIGLRDQPGAAVAWADDIDHVEIVLFYQPV